SKFADYLPLYRLEDIFERQGFEISRATQSVWCRDVADVVEPLYQRMAERVRKSHVVATDDTVLPMLSPGQTQPARMWVHVGDAANPYNIFDFILNRSREGDRKSTRLNSSHEWSSYAVFCLKDETRPQNVPYQIL